MDITNFDGLVCFKIERGIGRSHYSGIQDCLILESDARPDYYAWNNFPPPKQESGKKHLYLPVKNKVLCFQDIILRQNIMLQLRFGKQVRISPGYMSFLNEQIFCVRADLWDINFLDDLFNNLLSAGIQFIEDRKMKTYSSFIHYKRYAEFTGIQFGVYRDLNNPHRFLVPIDQHPDIRDLKPRVDTIKSNCDFYLFDSFLAEVFLRNKFLDFIGIYSEHCDEECLGIVRREIDKAFATSAPELQSPAAPYRF